LKIERLLVFGKETFLVATGQAGSALGGLFGIYMLTHLLDPDEYGALALAMTLSAFIQQVVIGPISFAALRFYVAASEANTLPEYLAAIKMESGTRIRLLAIVGLLASLCMLLLGWQPEGKLAATSVFFGLFSSYSSIIEGIQTGARRRGIVALHMTLGTFLRFAFAGLIVVAFAPTSAAAMSGFAIAAMLILTSQSYFLNLKIKKGCDLSQKELWAWRTRIKDYTWPFSIWGVPAWLQVSSERWALKASGSSYEVGLFSVLYQVGYYPISLLITVITQAVAPVLLGKASMEVTHDRQKEIITLSRISFWTVLVITAFGLGLAYWWGDSIFRILTDEDYHEATRYLVWMVLAAGLFGANQIIEIMILAGQDSSKLLFPKLLFAGTGITLNILLSYFWGMAGIIAANIFASCVFMAILLHLARLKIIALNNTGGLEIRR